MTFRALNIMLFGISLEGRDGGGKTGKQKKAFKFSDIVCLYGFFGFFKDSFSEEKNKLMGTESVLSWTYWKDDREGGISTNPLMIVPSMKRENSIFFSQEQITRTHHVSARMCFIRLRLKLTDQVHGVSCVCRAVTADIFFTFKIRGM